MRIAISNPDNIGDFILRQPLLAALLEAGHELLLITRDFVAPLAGDMFPAVTVLQCVGNPYDRNFHFDSPLGKRFLESVISFAPDIFVVAAYQHTQLEERLAAELPHADCIGFQGHLFQSRPEVTAVSTIRFATQVAVAAESREVEKNELLCAAILGNNRPLPAPRMTAHADGLTAAESRLAQLGLAGEMYWAVCAGDIAAKSVKNWEREQWAEFCRELLAQQNVHLLFIGSPDEHESTLAIQERMGEAGRRTATITGEPTSLRTLTGILARAEGYIGKDTGPMHIAAALGKPVLSIFGGGHWPRFTPSARTGASFTVRVPCTGCNWDCHLSRSHCVKDIPVSTVVNRAEAMLRGELREFQVEVVEPEPVLGAAILRELWDAARREHRKLEAERFNFVQWHEDRLRDIAQLKAELNEALAAKAEAGKILSQAANNEETVGGLSDRAQQLESKAAELEFESRMAQVAMRHAVEEKAAMARKLDRMQERAARKILASRQQVQALQKQNEELTSKLAETEDGRLSLARELDGWREKWQEAESELSAARQRLEETTIQSKLLQLQLDTVSGRELGQVADMERLLRRKSEELESALALIPDLREEMAQTNADMARQEMVLGALKGRLAECERDQEERRHLVEDLTTRLFECERDREERLRLIEDISASLAASEQDREARLRLIEDISARLVESDQDRAERLRVIEDISARLAESEQDRAARLRLIETLTRDLQELEADRANRGDQISALHMHIENLQKEIDGFRNLLPYRLLRKLKTK